MVLALDIGGTFIRVADVSGKKMRHRSVIRTPKNKKKLLKEIVHIIDSFGKREIICVSIAGFVKDGKVINSVNINLKNFDMKKYLENKFKARVYVQNDAKCGAMAENYYGEGNKYKNFVYICIGTGIGGAIFIDNKLYIGNAFAGEFGHMIVNEKEFEKNSSGSYFFKLIKRKKDKESIKIISDNLAKGILNIIYALDPQAIIIGGGFGSEHIDINELKKEIIKMDIIKREINIEKSNLEGYDSLIGAALQTKIKF